MRESLTLFYAAERLFGFAENVKNCLFTRRMSESLRSLTLTVQRWGCLSQISTQGPANVVEPG